MDYSLLVGIHDAELAEAGDDVDDFLFGVDSNEDSDLDSPREADSPQESDSAIDGEVPMSDTPPATPPANSDGCRERNTSFGSNEFDDREEEDDAEGFESVDGRYIYYPTAPGRVQITPKTSTNITRYCWCFNRGSGEGTSASTGSFRPDIPDPD